MMLKDAFESKVRIIIY